MLSGLFQTSRAKTATLLALLVCAAVMPRRKPSSPCCSISPDASVFHETVAALRGSPVDRSIRVRGGPSRSLGMCSDVEIMNGTAQPAQALPPSDIHNTSTGEKKRTASGLLGR